MSLLRSDTSRSPPLKDLSTEAVVVSMEWRRQAREKAEEKSSTQSYGSLIQLMYTDLYPWKSPK